MNEEWRDIPGYENYYQASTLGRIRSLDRIGGGTERGPYRLYGRVKKFRKPKGSNSVTVTLNKNGGMEIRTWAVWVWAAFNGFPSDGMCVIHKDGNRENYRPDNLALISLEEVGIKFGKIGRELRWSA